MSFDQLMICTVGSCENRRRALHRFRYTLPLAAAIILAIYAAIYALILLSFVSGGHFDLLIAALVCALLALATTPFFALVYLPRQQKDISKRAAIWMSVVMACPSLAWGVTTIQWIADLGLREIWFALGTAAVPAVLSIYLTVVFAKAAYRKRVQT